MENLTATPFPTREGGAEERSSGTQMIVQTKNTVHMPSPPSLTGKGVGGLGLRAAIPGKYSLLIPLIFATCLSLSAADDPPKLVRPPDITEELASARKFALEGEQLGAQARLKAADGKADESEQLYKRQIETYQN